MRALASPTRGAADNGSSALGSGSQGVLTFRDKMDTTSLFDVSCDSNGTPIGMMGGGESHRSRKKSQRNTFGQHISNQASAVVVAPGLLPSSRANSKTAREQRSKAPRIEGEN